MSAVRTMYLLKRPNRSSPVAGPCCPFSTTKAERVNFSGQSTTRARHVPFGPLATMRDEGDEVCGLTSRGQVVLRQSTA